VSGDPGWRAAVRAAVTPLPVPWAVGPALRAAAAAGAVLVAAMATGDLRVGGIVYLGVACAVTFVGRGDYRSRAALVAGQAVGACAGMTVGALVPGTAAGVVAAAAVVGALAGAVGRIGPASTAAAVMAVIGVAYTQFGRLAMPWWEPVLAYTAGSALLLALSLAGALVHPERYRRAAVSDVFAAAADLVDATGSGVDAARHRLALASATARTAVAGYRVRPVTGSLAEAWADARDAAARAARTAVVAGGDPAGSAESGRRWRARAAQLRTRPADRGQPSPAVHPGPALRAGVRAAVRAATDPEALRTGVRVGACTGVATALAVALHPPQHAFWIPLTVAVVLRPEYGPVLVRALHRLAGTVVGVLAVALVLGLTASPAWLCLAAVAALSLAALSAPRHYGLAVVGVTGSALLSVAVADPGGLQPGARLLDTVLGCAIAFVLGVLAWPRRGLPDQPSAFAGVWRALAAQVDRELRRGGEPAARAAATAEAYRVAHAWRAELERDLAEPDPARAAAVWLPVALQVEQAVDAVCAAAERERTAPAAGDAPWRAELARLLDRPRPPTTAVGAAELLDAVTTALFPSTARAHRLELGAVERRPAGGSRSPTPSRRRADPRSASPPRSRVRVR
jgi:uncharacterized membrane protein YccC